MKKDIKIKFQINRKKLGGNRLFTNLKLFLGIVLIGGIIFTLLEQFYLLLNKANKVSILEELEYFWLLLSVFSIIFLIILLFYFLWRLTIKSKRFDIFSTFIVSFCIIFFTHKFFIEEFSHKLIDTYGAYLQNTNIFLLINLLISSCLIAILIFLQVTVTRNGKSIFLSDKEVKNKEEDELGIWEDSQEFAKCVWNNNSTETIVFGLDAPWGSGKTSYINFCIKYWKSKKPKPILMEFHPLIYDGQKDLFCKFIDELISKITEEIYAPEIYGSLLRYKKIIKDVKVGYGGIGLSLMNNENSYDQIFNKLQEELKALDRKIIIIIDDLDRIQLKDVKTLLGVVRNAFYLPNVAFILCYDTENINTFETVLKTSRSKYKLKREEANQLTVLNSGARQSNGFNVALPESSITNDELNNTKISEYFEKIIQVKKTLILSREKIENYFLCKLDEVIGNDPLGLSKKSIDEIKEGILSLLKAENYGDYKCYIGDPRKIKRIMNFILVSEVFKVDYEDIDINFENLLKLLLIYINYPKIFRDIYINETSGMNGFFSVKNKFKDGRLSFENSKKYRDYLENLNEKESFLVKSLFDVTENKEEIEKMQDERSFRTSSVLFNGGDYPSNPNLREYLDLIVSKKHPEIVNQYNFHLNNIISLNDGKTISEIFNLDEYKKEKGENPRETFFNEFMKLLNSNSEKIKKEWADKLLEYVINNMSEYSLLDGFFKGGYSGIRKDMQHYIVVILDRKGWTDEDGKNYNNSDKENIIEIAYRILGEKEYSKKGILKQLSKEGILGIFDMLRFRGLCSRGGGGDSFNLYSSLAYHEDKNAKTDGVISKLNAQGMREISQKCFEIFQKEYIKKGKNIFEEVAMIKEEEILGDFSSYIKKEFEKQNLSLDDEIKKIKNSIISFIVHQLGNPKKENEIGCGYYNPTGKDPKHGISKIMQSYFFNVCFDASKEKNIIYLIEFLLSHPSVVNNFRGEKFVLKISEFEIFFNGDLLREYWIRNRLKIEKVLKKDKIVTYGYSIKSEDILNELIVDLDENSKKLLIYKLAYLLKRIKQ